MTKINIEGLIDINDPFYRYTMEKLNIVRQRTKTVIDNLDIVCKDLERDPKLLIDFFKRKLNISFTYKNNLLSMTSNIDYNVFHISLREFIEFYVLCEKCRLPETIISKQDDRFILLCKCCAHKTSRQLKK